MIDDGYSYMNDCDDGTHWGAPDASRDRCSCCGKHLHEMSAEHAPQPAQPARRPGVRVDLEEEITEEDRRWAREEQAWFVNSDPLRWRG